jgi:hypothetical protein
MPWRAAPIVAAFCALPSEAIACAQRRVATIAPAQQPYRTAPSAGESRPCTRAGQGAFWLVPANPDWNFSAKNSIRTRELSRLISNYNDL